MLKRYGRYLVAVGLGLAVLAVADIAVRIAIPSQPRQPNIAGYSRPERPFHSENTDPKDCEQRDAAPLNKTPRIANHALEETRKRDCRAYAKSEETLKYETLDYAARQANAAEEAVRSAYDQVRIAWWQTATTVGALIAAAIAAYWAAKAAHHTDRGANAAENALTITQLGELRQLRAYVHISSATLHHESHQFGLHVAVKIANFGLTPAHSMQVERRAYVGDFPLTEKLPPTEKDKGRFILPPNGDPVLLTFPSGEWVNQDQRWGTPGTALYVYGTIRYVDAFKKRRTTKFRIYCLDIRAAGMNPADQGNDAT